MAVGSVVGALAAGARGQRGPATDDRRRVRLRRRRADRRRRAHPAPGAAALVPLGAASVTFAAAINSSLQLAAEPAMRGRVMALYSIVFLGSTPIGGPIAGWLSESIDPRAGLVLAGAAGLIAALGARAALARRPASLPASADPPCEPVRSHRPAAAGGGWPAGMRSRPSPGVRTSLTG